MLRGTSCVYTEVYPLIAPGGRVLLWFRHPSKPRQPVSLHLTVDDNVKLALTVVTRIGDVVIENGASIWYGAVLRGDEGKIIVGSGSNVQDNAVIHTTPEHPTELAESVTIGHGALLEGCKIGSGSVIGMGSVVLENVTVGAHTMLAAGSVAVPGTVMPPETLWAGAPAMMKKRISGSALRSLETSSTGYDRLRHNYLSQRLGEVHNAES